MHRRLLFVLLVIALVTMACSFSVGTPAEPTEPPVPPTREVQPTHTPEPTQAPTEEPTVEPTATEAPLPTLAIPTEGPTEEVVDEPVTEDPPAFFLEEFDYGADLWSYFTMSGDEDDMILETEDGRLVADLDGPDIYAYILYDEYTYYDVGVEALFENRGVNSNNVSLICRYMEDEGWYEFNIGSDGLYNILRYDSRAGEYIALATGGSNSINMGKDVNLYTIVCEDDELTLYINGKETKTVRDRTLHEGQVGVSVSSFDQYPVVVEFESVEIFEP